MREAIHMLKFGGVRRVAGPLGRLLVQGGGEVVADVVVSVPMEEGRLRERGLDHALLIAKWYARDVGLPLVRGVLYKKRGTPEQVGLSRTARMMNLRGAFGVRGEAVRGKAVVLVDDVITTGATVRECARVLKKAGAERIYVVALARTY